MHYRQSALLTRQRQPMLSLLALAAALPPAGALAHGDPAPAPVAAHAAAEADGAAVDDVVVVTATKRASTVQKVPFSINAQSAEDIRRAGAVTIEDLSRNVAGLAVQNLGPGQSQIAIRGVSAGQIVRDQPGVKEQVGIYLDESVISTSLFTPDLDLYDLDRVETLRGPQGTLFGSGSVGGTIRYISRQPRIGQSDAAIEANVNLVGEADFGGHIKGAVNVPLGDKAAARGVGYATRYGGFIDALGPDGTRRDNVNSGSRTGGRLAVVVQPHDSVRLTPRIVYQDVRANGFNREDVYNLLANPYTTDRPPRGPRARQQYLLLPERFHDRTLMADVTASIDLGSVDATSVTSYMRRNIEVQRDSTAPAAAISTMTGLPPAAALIPAALDDKTALNQVTQELRLASTGNGPLQWVLGGYYSSVERIYDQSLSLPGFDALADAALGAGHSAAVANGAPPDHPYTSHIPYRMRQKAVFGEASYARGAVRFTAGGRYYDFNEQRSFRSGGLFGSGVDRRDGTRSHGFSPRMIASIEAAPDVTINLQAAKGFRLGGVNDPLNLASCSPADRAIFSGYDSYRDESLWNYEAGVKSRFHGITFNAALFHTAIRNLQLTLDAATCSSRVVFNVPKAHSRGAEFELSARPLRGFDLSLSASLLDSRFDASVRDGAGVVLGGIRDGNRLPSVPKFSGAATARYSHPAGDLGDGFVQASLQHVSSRYTLTSDQEQPRRRIPVLPVGNPVAGAAAIVDLKLPAYTLINLSAGLDAPQGLGVSVYVNNLFDISPRLSVDREIGGLARLGYQLGQPRQIGMTVRRSF